MLNTVLENVPSCTGWTNITQYKQISVAGNFCKFYLNAKFTKVSGSRNFPVSQYYYYLSITSIDAHQKHKQSPTNCNSCQTPRKHCQWHHPHTTGYNTMLLGWMVIINNIVALVTLKMYYTRDIKFTNVAEQTASSAVNIIQAVIFA